MAAVKKRTDANRRARQAERFSVLLKLLFFVVNTGGSMRTIKDKFGLSERTIYRYLNVLKLAGIPVVVDAASGIYSVETGYRLPTAR